jgi:hypothetical protein
MTTAEARQRFLQDPIVVHFGQDARSRKVRDWIVGEIGDVSGVKLEFVEIDEAFPPGAKVFHNGDVITGQRLVHFVSYVRKLGDAGGKD